MITTTYHNTASFTWSDATQFASENNTICIALLLAYVPTVMGLQLVMKQREPFRLDTLLKCWNCLLSVLSLTGFTIIFNYLIRMDLLSTLSSLDYSNGVVGLTVFLFNVSKFPEMVDTLFIVLRKKQLTFLHVFHHLSVVVYCYLTLFWPTPLGIWYAGMNTFIHGVMYGYFAFAKEIRKYTNFNPIYLTLVQIIQMTIGITVNLVYVFLPTTQYNSVTIFNLIYGILMYGSYMYLFCSFFAKKYTFKTPINWFMCVYLFVMHLFALLGFNIASWTEIAQCVILYQICGLGVTAGMHRLWSHRSYKATAPVRFVLMILASMSNQGSIYHWCRDHRVHHKNSDTDADPHNINRGFFYSHIGWLLLVKDDAVRIAGKDIPCDDLLKDPFVWINHKLNPWWDQFWCFVVPGLYGLWQYNSFYKGFVIFGALRWILEAHATWTVNSVAHTFGYRPYKDIPPSESFITSLLANGEGWHNWHHAYPFDYATSENGIFAQWNPSKIFIDVLAVFGQTYDLKRHVPKINVSKVE